MVTQPFEGAKENGALGFITGIGKGIGGLVLKPGAGECYVTMSDLTSQ